MKLLFGKLVLLIACGVFLSAAVLAQVVGLAGSSPVLTPFPPRPPVPTPTPNVTRLAPIWLTPRVYVTAVPARQGAFIQLQVPGARADWDTLVQWQDGTGEWHAVDGWSGSFDNIYGGLGYKTWWLPGELLGRGPFRWAIAQEGQIVAHSAGFYLPRQAGQTVIVTVSAR